MVGCKKGAARIRRGSGGGEKGAATSVVQIYGICRNIRYLSEEEEKEEKEDDDEEEEEKEEEEKVVVEQEEKGKEGRCSRVSRSPGTGNKRNRNIGGRISVSDR